MPKRRRDNHIKRTRRRRPYKRAKYKRRPRRKARSTLTIPRIFPDRAVVNHKYCTRGTVALTSSSPLQTVSFRANGMYDPEYALGGTQPLMFDQMTAHYDHYTVVGSKIKVRLWTDGTSVADTDPILCYLSLDDGALTPSVNLIKAREQPGGSYATSNQIGKVTTLSKGFSAKKMFGKAHSNIVGESELRGSVSADPSEGAYFNLSFQDMETMFLGDTDSIASIHYEVEIYYKGVWTERKLIVSS